MNVTVMIDVRTAFDYYLIGIGDSGDFLFLDEVVAVIGEHCVFAGGDRHYELVRNRLPKDHEWVPIKGKMEAVVRSFEAHDEPVVIFASGDPYFYGFGNTLKRLRPEARVKAFPYFNSIQLLSHQLHLNYSKVVHASVHGRGWDELDEALISGKAWIGVLTDGQKTPAAIAERMLDHGFKHYQMTVGEALDGPGEKITSLSISEATTFESQSLNCVILKKTGALATNLGIDDQAFLSLPGRPGMITKRPIRLTTLSALKLNHAEVFWDVGSCTGSVVIEAKRLMPGLKAIAFEKRTECEAIISENTRRFQAPGIQVVIGDVFELDLDQYPAPDVIFIGGHGNRLEEMIERMDHYLLPGGRLVMNTVKEDSATIFLQVCERLGFQTEPPVAIAVDDFNPIKIVSACKQQAPVEKISHLGNSSKRIPESSKTGVHSPIQKREFLEDQKNLFRNGSQNIVKQQP